VGFLDADGRANDVWLLDLARGTKSRLTFDPQSESDPVWSPDGTRIVFTSNRGTDGHIHLYTKPISGTGDDELLIKEDMDDIPTSWSPDGQSILFMRYGPTNRGGIWLLSLNGQREAKPLLQSPGFDQAYGIFSPNGRFVAYVSHESGRNEVYVQTFPPGNKSVISSGGGVYPMWRGDGKELFYLTEDGRVLAAQIKSEAPFQTEVPQQLFQTNIKFGAGCPYAVNRDGSRFLIFTPAEASDPAPLTVMLNWTASLKQPK
jgi:Tol biopolymer transport system component